MDLAKDVVRLLEKVSNVPGLKFAYDLVLKIINTVQLIKENSANLQQIAHFVALRLIKLAECMDGNWDQASDRLKTVLDDYEVVLQDILRAVTKLQKKSTMSSFASAFMDPTGRETEITLLKEHFQEAEKSILLAVGLDTSILVNQVKDTVVAQQHIELDTNNRINEIAPLVRETYSLARQFVGRSPPQPTDEDGFDLYARKDIKLISKICEPELELIRYRFTTIKLYHAERCIDGRAVVVKVYEGQREDRAHEFSKSIAVSKSLWDPSFLQFIGASRPSENIPFGVYQSLTDRCEPFYVWYDRTLSSTPVNAILGLYDMRTAIRSILDTPIRATLGLEENMLYDCIVNTQCHGSSSLVYVGELESRNWGRRVTTASMYSSLSEQQARRSRPDKSSEYHVAYLVNLFCAGGAAWSDNALDINNALGVDVASMDINTLGTSLFDNGWMGWCSSQEFPKGCPSLGDIGYMSSNGSFVRIDNLHQSLRFSGVHTYIGGPGTWESEVDDGGIVNSGGRSYHRYKMSLDCIPVAGFTLGLPARLESVETLCLWDARVERVCGALGAHNLILVTGITRSYTVNWGLIQNSDEDTKKYAGLKMEQLAGLPHVTVPINMFTCGFPLNMTPGDSSEFYEADPVYVRASLNPEPGWLQSKEDWENGFKGGYDEENGFILRNYSTDLVYVLESL